MGTLIDEVRHELDVRLQALGGELPGQLDYIKKIATEFPNYSVAKIADTVQKEFIDTFYERLPKMKI